MNENIYSAAGSNFAGQVLRGEIEPHDRAKRLAEELRELPNENARRLFCIAYDHQLRQANRRSGVWVK